MIGQMAMRVKNQKQAATKEEASVKNTLQGNYWTGGQGYGMGVSSLLYEDGARGGSNRHNTNTF